MSYTQAQELEALYKLMHERGWPDADKDPELCMQRAREFLDCARLIYPEVGEDE